MTRKTIIYLLAVTLLGSCVSSKKYEETLNQQKKCQEELNSLKTKNQELSGSASDLELEISKLKSSRQSLLQDTIRLSKQLADISGQFLKLKTDYETMLENLNNQLSGNKSDISKILSDLQKNREDLLKQENKLNIQKKELEDLTLALEAKEAKLIELQSILSKKDSIVNALKAKLSQALLGYENKGLTILKKNGKIYVSLEEKLLFSSGSYSIAPEGTEALKKLAKVLEGNPDINIMIEGHTDDVPYNGVGQLKDNWDLSVMRATSVLKILLQGSSIDPTRLIAAGRSEYVPINKEKTKEARTTNRRTEIILTPKLDELFKMLESN